MIDARFAHPYCIESVTDQSSEVQFSPWSVGGDAGQVVSSNVRFLICIFNVDNNKIVVWYDVTGISTVFAVVLNFHLNDSFVAGLASIKQETYDIALLDFVSVNYGIFYRKVLLLCDNCVSFL